MENITYIKNVLIGLQRKNQSELTRLDSAIASLDKQIVGLQEATIGVNFDVYLTKSVELNNLIDRRARLLDKKKPLVEIGERLNFLLNQPNEKLAKLKITGFARDLRTGEMVEFEGADALTKAYLFGLHELNFNKG
jgi:hypothetical protein